MRLTAWIGAGVLLVVAITSVLTAGTPPGSRPLAQATDGRPKSSQPAALASPTPTASPEPTPTPSRSPTGSDTPAISSSIVECTVNRTSISLVATYDAAVSLGFNRRTLSVDETITVRNASGGPIDRIELNTVIARIGELRLGAVTADEREARVAVSDQTIVVRLGGCLPDGATVQLGVRLSATLRADLLGSNWLFTRTNGIVSANRWLPWISLRRPFDRPNYGDPFITASSPFVRVRITTDQPLVIAATGRRVATSRRTQTFVARDVRDFNLTASPSYRVHTRRVGPTTVRVYATAGYPVSTVMGYVTDAIARMGALVGSYPYPTFTVAESAGGTGMESPELIWIPGGLAGRQLHWMVYHETAHQWFYGIVGSDQAYQPFADEAAADHLARTTSGLWRGSYCATGRLDLAIYRYSSGCYFEIIYVQGTLLLEEVRKRMGTTTYWRAMRHYVDAHRFGISSTRALLANLQAHTSVDLRPVFAARFPSLY
jgi:hypothetical protein